MECVREHIRCMPTVAPHYNRTKSPHRKYLSTELSMTRLYYLYQSWMREKHPNVETVKRSVYRTFFTSEFNLGFTPVKMDTCNTCDKLHAQIDVYRIDPEKEEQVQELERKLTGHQDLARKGQTFLTNFTSVYNSPDILPLCFDLQQTLPTPKMSTGVAYYKRKLWTFNFCVYNLKIKKIKMFVWDEVTAKRSSVEIASWVLKYIEDQHNPDLDKQLLLVLITALDKIKI